MTLKNRSASSFNSCSCVHPLPFPAPARVHPLEPLTAVLTQKELTMWLHWNVKTNLLGVLIPVLLMTNLSLHPSWHREHWKQIYDLSPIQTLSKVEAVLSITDCRKNSLLKLCYVQCRSASIIAIWQQFVLNSVSWNNSDLFNFHYAVTTIWQHWVEILHYWVIINLKFSRISLIELHVYFCLSCYTSDIWTIT